jgi:hypothetical protein
MFENCKYKIANVNDKSTDPMIQKIFIAINCNKLDHFKNFIEEFGMDAQKEFIKNAQETSINNFIDNILLEHVQINEDVKSYEKVLNKIKMNDIDTSSVEEIYNETLIVIKTHMKVKILDITTYFVNVWNNSKDIGVFYTQLEEKIKNYTNEIKKIETVIIKREIKILSRQIEKITTNLSDYKKLETVNYVLNNLWEKIKSDYEKNFIDKEFMDIMCKEISIIKPMIITKLQKIIELEENKKHIKKEVKKNIIYFRPIKKPRANVENNIKKLLNALKIT